MTQGAPSYEAARDELADVVRQLEQGGATLEQSLALWERGEQLAKVCQRWLEGAQQRLDTALSDQAAGQDLELGERGGAAQRPDHDRDGAVRPDQRQ